MPRKPSTAPKASWLYDLILTIFAPLLDIFFREIQVRGSWRVPNHGAIILVAAPHANQFVDSLVLMRIMRTLHRRVSWLMAEKSFGKPVIGVLAEGIGALPVARVMDNVKSAEGRIYLQQADEQARILSGRGTNFDRPMFGAGASLYLPSIEGETFTLNIVEILNSEAVVVRSLPTDERFLRQLRVSEGTEFKVAPHIDQTGVYQAVFDRLRKDDGCVGIFPEGGSHDRPDLLPLKAGIAIMALGAMAEGVNVTVVPVGMNYFHPHKFRSRAVVEFGDPVHVPPRLISDFKTGKKRESVGALLSGISQGLTAVTVTAPDFDTLMIIHAARRLYSTNRDHMPLSTVLEINRRLVKGYAQYKNDPRIEELSTSVSQYIHQLDHLGLRDYQVEYARFSYIYVLSVLLYRVGKLAILAIATLPGLLLFSPVFIAARYYSHKKTSEALAASSVKIKGNDVMATWKILIAAGLTPLLYTYYAILLAVGIRYTWIGGLIPAHIPIWTIIAGAYVLFACATYAALRLGEIGMDILKSLWPLILCLSPSSAGTLAKLRTRRKELAEQVTQLVDTLGPDLFPDCDAAKLPQPRKLYYDVSPEISLEDLADSDFFSQKVD